MGQLTLKELEGRIVDVHDRIDLVKHDIQTIGEGFVEVDRLIGELQAAPAAVEITFPLNVIRAIIEALHGVRLQRAGEYAQALELEYFPVEDVEPTEGN